MRLRFKFLLASTWTVLLALVVAPASLLRPTHYFVAVAARESGQFKYPFQNPDLPSEERITNILSLMTLDEKVECLGTNPSVPRLGIRGANHMEGIHGLSVGGPGKWGGNVSVPTTTFPQGYGLGETWDAELLRQAASVEGYEARYIFQTAKFNKSRSGLVIRSPNADLGRDPR
ncbi:MAG TPA: hypothetical protein VF666_10870 [Pyrinomonadaceae bacterium]|jgi:beta-glucosidase